MAKKHNIIIVGNGLFGSIAARLARAEGHAVTVISDDQPLSASKASGCVLAPSWLNSMDKAAIETAMAVLGILFRVHDMEFQTALRPFKAKRVALADVLVEPDFAGHVYAIEDGKVFWVDNYERAHQSRGKVLVAAGIWCKDLIPGMPTMRGLYGASVVFKGVQLDAPRLSVWAPYKQAVGFNLDKKHVWFGDGTAPSLFILFLLYDSVWYQAEQRHMIVQTNGDETEAEPTSSQNLPGGELRKVWISERQENERHVPDQQA